MSDLIQRGLPCPWCGSGDARAEYENNFYCFSCHRSVKKSERKSFKLQEAKPILDELWLPKGSTSELPIETLAWLYSNHMTDELIKKADIQYTSSCPIYSKRLDKYFEAGPRVVFPYWDEELLLYYEARSLDKNNNLKYVGDGGKKIVYKSEGFNAPKAKAIVIVEDILSAIRVGEVLPAVAIRGTSVNDQKYLQLVNSADKFIIWLDGDLPGQSAARKLGEKLAWAGEVCYIKTNRDPKTYSKDKIHQLIVDSYGKIT